MDRLNLDCNATWVGGFLAGLQTGGDGRIDGATVGFAAADADSSESLGVGPALALPDYPSCYLLPAETVSSSAAQPGPAATPLCLQGTSTVTSNAAATSKQEAWYEPADRSAAGGCSQAAAGPSSQLPQLRCHSTPITLRWLHDNYELREGVCIPRSVIYQHYTICCFENGMSPVNAASFGKIARHQYPELTTRRLGTRGKSRYYYYGLAVAPTSRFYKPEYSNKYISVKPRKHCPTPCNCKVALPGFPSLSRLGWYEAGVQETTLHRFDTMYRAHCQRLLDLVTAGFFEEVKEAVVQFWHSMPQHVRVLLHHELVVQVVGSCDRLLYHTMAETLIPNQLEASLEFSLRCAEFGEQLRGWLITVLYQTPPQLQAVKLECCYELERLLQRLPQLARAQQASCPLLNDQQTRVRLLAAWRAVDLYEVTLLTHSAAQHTDFYCLTNVVSEFEGILQAESGVTSFLRFVDRLLGRFFSKDGCVGGTADAGTIVQLEHGVRCVYLAWETFCGEMLRRMAHTGAGSSLYNWLTEYLQYRLQMMRIRHLSGGDQLALQPRPSGRTSSTSGSPSGRTSGNTTTSDNSYAGSDDSSTQRSPPTSEVTPDLPGTSSGRPHHPRDIFAAVPGYPTDWQVLKQDDSFCEES